MEDKRDIANLADVKLLVDTFYGKVRDDSLLSQVFDPIVGDRWPQHLEKMYRFWQTVLLKDHTYFGSPFSPHAKMPINGTHFARWMKLFCETADELFAGEKAEEAKWRAGKMAEMFQAKIEFYRNSPSTPLL